MGARWYEGRIGRWVSADTIVPDFTVPQSLNRYAYVGNRPLLYADPSGHIACLDDECLLRVHLVTGQVIRHGLSLDEVGWLVQFSADEGTSWHSTDRFAVSEGIRADAQRLTEHLGMPLDDAPTLFLSVMRRVNFHRTTDYCDTGCWAEVWVPRVTVYANAPQGRFGTRVVGHELGHMFAQRAARQPYRDLEAEWASNPDFPRRDPHNLEFRGYAGPRWTWQQSEVLTSNEEFADMFLGWTYGRWETSARGDLTSAGAARSAWMDVNMAEWISIARTR